ncbi:hypothetical protein [Blastococcus mobilis]|uniref:hypothetical protein n=1 Tax=Blastococcus mobilis TaxID=1938746 RepID=UPI000B78E2E4|nr:hypothetical protein [Blastococcus mobilis]
MFRCRYEQDGEAGVHYFTVVTRPKADARLLIDQAVAAPPCPRPEHTGRHVWPNGTYKTAAGERQRYRCVNREDDSDYHSFSAELPRAVVEEETCCPDCEVLTPRHAGTEAASRRLNVPTPVVVSVLRDLADGHAYTAVSKRALEQMKRPTGRVRTVGGKTPDELHEAGQFGPRRELKAHWHLSADILERFAPFVTEPAFEAMRVEEAAYRAEGLPVVYFADEVSVKRDYARSATLTSAPVVWTALVVSRTRWERDKDGRVTGRSSRLVRVRALPNASAEAWRLVLAELDAPNFLVADGAAAIEKAATAVWGKKTTVVPCMFHATRNIEANLTPTRGGLADKVRDHMYALSRDLMRDGGPKAVSSWFDDLEDVTAAADLPADLVAAQRRRYEPLLRRTALVAQRHNDPEVQVSNAAVEAQIRLWVKRMTTRRGAMFSNLARTNLLGDLIVTGANGALLDQHEVARAIRHASKTHRGWAPPPRALTEPAGVLGLRDAFSVTELLERHSS